MRIPKVHPRLVRYWHWINAFAIAVINVACAAKLRPPGDHGDHGSHR
jgi:hypothetical protein